MTPTASAISAELIAAYRKRVFRVLHPCLFTLRIDAHSDELKAVYSKRGVEAAAFLTAWNPLSEATSRQVNAEAQAALMRRLADTGYPLRSGLGIDPAGDWPREESMFVPGLDLDSTMKLGAGFLQNAVVWAVR